MKYYIIIVIILAWYWLSGRKEGLEVQPTNQEKENMSSIILQHTELFKKDNFSDAKKAMKWMDPVLYEDIRKLIINDKFNKQNIMYSM